MESKQEVTETDVQQSSLTNRKQIKKSSSNADNDDSGSHVSSYSSFSNEGSKSIVSSTTHALSQGLNHIYFGDQWRTLLFGQLLSLILAGVDLTSSELYLKCSLSAPLTMIVFVYIVLTMHIFPVCWIQIKKKKTQEETGIETGQRSNSNLINHKLPFFRDSGISLLAPWFYYFFVAALDVESNYFLVMAFKYTSVTSVAILTSLSIPGAMVTSRIIFKNNYRKSHIIGAIICISGTALNVYSDWISTDRTLDRLYPHKTIGDLFACLGGFLFGMNDAVSELLIKKISALASSITDQYGEVDQKTYRRNEYIGMTGFFGLILAFFQAYFFEFDDMSEIVQSVSSTFTTIGSGGGSSSTCEVGTSFSLVVLFIITSYMKNVGDYYFLQQSEAALLNLSLLTSDLYVSLLSIFLQDIIPSFLVFASFILIAIGVVIYESAPSPMVNPNDNIDDMLRGSGDGFDLELPMRASEVELT